MNITLSENNKMEPYSFEAAMALIQYMCVCNAERAYELLLYSTIEDPIEICNRMYIFSEHEHSEFDIVINWPMQIKVRHAALPDRDFSIDMELAIAMLHFEFSDTCLEYEDPEARDYVNKWRVTPWTLAAAYEQLLYSTLENPVDCGHFLIWMEPECYDLAFWMHPKEV